MTQTTPMTGQWTIAEWWESRSTEAKLAAALQANARMSYRELSKIVDGSESTVARKVKQMVADGVVRSTVVVDPIRCGMGFPVSVFFSAPNGSLRPLLEKLIDRDDVRLVAMLTGKRGVLAEMIVPDTLRLAEVLTDDLGETDLGIETLSEPVIREFKGSVDWARTLVGSNIVMRPRLADLGVEAEYDSLDPTDHKLVTQLQLNGRSSLKELSAAAGVSESAVHHRIEALLSSGRIHPVTLVDSALLGFETQAFIWLTVAPSEIESVALVLAARPEVRYLAATLGDADLFLEVVLPAQHHLYRFRTEVLGRISAVTGMSISLNIHTFKRAFVTLRGSRFQHVQENE